MNRIKMAHFTRNLHEEDNWREKEIVTKASLLASEKQLRVLECEQ